MNNFVFPIKSGVDIRRARLLLNINQVQLAKIVGLQSATICRAEKEPEVKDSLALAIECLLRRKQAGEPIGASLTNAA